MPNWREILNEIQQVQAGGQFAAQTAQDQIRRKYLDLLHQADRRQRNIIAYYSGFLSKPGIFGTDINDEDKNGFMMAIHGLDPKFGLDLILHTPGGSLAATESLVDYLHRKFGNDIRVIVPQIAMSAGTMMACASREILIGRQSSLGPVDPQLNGIPAAGVLAEFEKALEEYKDDPDSLQIWKFIISQYTPSYLGQCKNAVDRAKDFVRRELEHNMLSAIKNAKTRKKKANTIVDALTDFSGNKGHDRHIHYDELQTMGLEVKLIEDISQTYQDLVLSVHHCYMHALMNTLSFKIIENHVGVAFVKNQAVQMPGFPMVQQNP